HVRAEVRSGERAGERDREALTRGAGVEVDAVHAEAVRAFVVARVRAAGDVDALLRREEENAAAGVEIEDRLQRIIDDADLVRLQRDGLLERLQDHGVAGRYVFDG